MIKCNAPLSLEILPLHFLCIAGLIFVLWNAVSWRTHFTDMFAGYKFFFLFFLPFFTTGSEMRQYRFLRLCQSKRHRLKIFYCAGSAVFLCSLLLCFKAQANDFNICFNIRSILLNAVKRLMNDVGEVRWGEVRWGEWCWWWWDGKRFQYFIQQNFTIGLVITSGLSSTRETQTRAPF